MTKTYITIINDIDNIENSDDNIMKLQRAMDFFCGTHDKCEGYKHALISCLVDQFENHLDDQSPRDLITLSDILTK